MACKPEKFQEATLAALRAYWWCIPGTPEPFEAARKVWWRLYPDETLANDFFKLIDRYESKPYRMYTILRDDLFGRNLRAGLEFQSFFQEYWEWLADQ